MHLRKIKKDIMLAGAVDWDRRLFDSLIPLPDGTSYNAYVVRGGGKTALIDTVDPRFSEVLMRQLEEVPELDYVIANHAEQDHSGALPDVLARYGTAVVLTSPKGRKLLTDHLGIPNRRIRTVQDGETLSLGQKTLEFIHTPWVHWPETMCTFLQEEAMLFSCDFFGSHLATSDLYATDKGRVYEAAKRYYAEIMMPFRTIIQKNLDKVEARKPALIAPSHGPLYNRPPFILKAYRDWTADTPRNSVVIPYVSMHGSTRALVDRLTGALTERGVTVHRFELSGTDLGKLAISLVDAATIVLGVPTVHVGPHPAVAYAAMLANALRPKARFAGIIGSYGWSTKAAETVAGLIPNLKVELLEPVVCRGYPRDEDLAAVDTLADRIAEKHDKAKLI